MRASCRKGSVLFGLTEWGLKTLAHFGLGDIPVAMSSMEKDMLK